MYSKVFKMKSLSGCHMKSCPFCTQCNNKENPYYFTAILSTHQTHISKPFLHPPKKPFHGQLTCTQDHLPPLPHRLSDAMQYVNPFLQPPPLPPLTPQIPSRTTQALPTLHYLRRPPHRHPLLRPLPDPPPASSPTLFPPPSPQSPRYNPPPVPPRHAPRNADGDLPVHQQHPSSPARP